MEKDARPRRRHADGVAAGGGGGRTPGVPMLKVVGGGALVILGICSWQFMLLARHVEPGDAVSSRVGEAVWRYLGAHESNLTSLSMQQRDLARITAQLAEDLLRQRQELARVTGRLQEPLQGGTKALPDATVNVNHQQAQELEDQNRRIAELQQTIANLQATLRGSPAAGGSGAAQAAGGPPVLESRTDDEYPAEWLASFSKETLDASAMEADRWRQSAKDAFLHAWRGYQGRAWGKDEMKPVTGENGRTWANCGMQILDALSTMWVMGLTAEFDEATQWVENSLNFDYGGLVSFFEITIRALGGLVSAHSLSGRPIFLTKARELADKLLPAFGSEEPWFPSTQVNLQTGEGAPGWFAGTVLAEAGTVQLEFRYLSQQTNDPKYAQKADKAMRSILTAAKGRGLVPWGLNRRGHPHFTNAHVTFGAMGDSYYEYLLKMYVQTSKTEPEWKDAWKQAMSEMHQRLILKTRGGLTYVAEEQNGSPTHKMDHLACFVGGMLIYGSRTLPKAEVDAAWERTAEGITETCYQMYHRQPSHLAPECISLRPDSNGPRDMEIWNNAAHYLLRPEAAEAIFYMFYYTGDPKYRRMAGEIMDAIEAHTRTTYGYSAVKDVRMSNPELRNEMETFFLAETLKYLYLTFLPNPRKVVNLDEFVFNTEAHPIRIHRPASDRGGQFLARQKW